MSVFEMPGGFASGLFALERAITNQSVLSHV